MLRAFEALNAELARENVKGEVGVVGGAAAGSGRHEGHRRPLDTHDAQDLRTLICHLALRRVEEVLEVVENYYPRNQIPAKTQYFLEELFNEQPARE